MEITNLEVKSGFPLMEDTRFNRTQKVDMRNNGAMHCLGLFTMTEPDKTATNGTLQVQFDEARVPECAQDSEKVGRKCCQYGFRFWCRKYFWEGQHLQEGHQERLENLPDDMSWYERFLLRHRRLVAFMIPALLFHFCWWAIMIQHNLWHLFVDSYYISITMIFGSIMAGMTSVGGGAVAFPVLTLVFNIPPHVARDFSMMIQSCGMSAAAFTIFFMHVQIEKVSLILSSVGGAVGCVFGLHLVSPYLSSPQKKMMFVNIFFAFGVVLAYLNRQHKRKTFTTIQHMNFWKYLVLFVTGFVGGIFTSFSGNGIDITYFSIVTLLFRISEKVATPTSVIVMAVNSLIGFFWRGAIIGDISPEAWQYLTVCVPIVVFGAPIGSVLGSHFHRLILAAFVMLLVTASLIGAYAVIRPLTPGLVALSVSIMVGGVVIFALIAVAGWKLLKYQERNSPEDETKEVKVGMDNPAYENGSIGNGSITSIGTQL